MQSIIRSVICLTLLNMSFMFFSCDNTSTTAVAYHDSLVMEQVKIAKLISELNATLETYVPEDMELIYNQVNEQIDKSLEKVNTIADFKGDKSFHEATGNLIAAYKDLTVNEYQEAVRLLSKPDSLFTDDHEALVNDLLKKIDSKLSDFNTIYSKEQKSFADKNGLSTEK